MLLIKMQRNSVVPPTAAPEMEDPAASFVLASGFGCVQFELPAYE
jgi:hypothetical protein